MRFTHLVIVAFLATGCTDEVDEVDGPDDSFLDSGKADTGGISESSPIACAVLKLVNQFNAPSLMNAVGVASDAANRIFAHRSGADGVIGTMDDDPFDTLAELDAVPYVGVVAFGKLRTYAEAHDWTATCGLTNPVCGGTEIHHSTSADRTTSAPPRDSPQIVVDQLGKGWQGSVSFDLDVVGCNAGSGMRYTDFVVVDGNNHASSHNLGTRSYEAMTLPVTIKAAGISGGPSCSPTAYIKRIRFATVGTSCLPGRTVRSYFTTPGGEAAAFIGKDMMKAKVKFSAKVEFYANYTAPHCARVTISGGSDSVTLSPTSPVTIGLVELQTPLKVMAIPTCTSSRLSSPEAADADFRVLFSPIALGPPL